MKETQRNSQSTTNKHTTLPDTPSREEFHRYASNHISEYDFSTDYPGAAGSQINNVASALRFTKSLAILKEQKERARKRVNNNDK